MLISWGCHMERKPELPHMEKLHADSMCLCEEREISSQLQPQHCSYKPLSDHSCKRGSNKNYSSRLFLNFNFRFLLLLVFIENKEWYKTSGSRTKIPENNRVAIIHNEETGSMCLRNWENGLHCYMPYDSVFIKFKNKRKIISATTQDGDDLWKGE